MKVPGDVGVPVILIVLLAQDAETPAGKPLGVSIPVAPVVVCVIEVNGVLIHKVGVELGRPTVLKGIITTGTSVLEEDKQPVT